MSGLWFAESYSLSLTWGCYAISENEPAFHSGDHLCRNRIPFISSTTQRVGGDSAEMVWEECGVDSISDYYRILDRKEHLADSF